MDLDIIKMLQDKKKRLENTLDFARSVCNELYSEPERCSEIMFKLVKLYTDRILSDKILGVIEETKNENYRFWNLMFENIKNISDEIFDSTEYIELPQDINLNIPEIPIIISPFSKRKLKDNIVSCDTDKENWKQQTGMNAQSFILYLPIGITFLYNNGNHSVSSGYIKCAGKIRISKDNPYTQVCDMSKLYDIIKFDGVYYRLISTGKKIARAGNFEFGTAFEIGRIIRDNNISFTYQKE